MLSVEHPAHDCCLFFVFSFFFLLALLIFISSASQLKFDLRQRKKRLNVCVNFSCFLYVSACFFFLDFYSLRCVCFSSGVNVNVCPCNNILYLRRRRRRPFRLMYDSLPSSGTHTCIYDILFWYLHMILYAPRKSFFTDERINETFLLTCSSQLLPIPSEHVWCGIFRITLI